MGIRTLKPTLRNAEERLAGLRTREGVPLPENTQAELRRDMVRLRLVSAQIKEIVRELAAGAPAQKGPHAMSRLITRVLAIGIETADMLVN